MPTYSALMQAGVTGDNGMTQAFPPNTGVGWFTMATGAYPADHGSTNNTYFRSGDGFNNPTSFSAANVLQADTIANAAERAGKKVAQIDWVGGAAANIAGPTVDFTNFFSNRGVLVGQATPSSTPGRISLASPMRSRSVVAASGWSDVPAGDPRRHRSRRPGRSTARLGPTRRALQRLHLRQLADAAVNYDHAIVSPVGKTGHAPSVDLAVGDFLPVKLTGANGLIVRGFSRPASRSVTTSS